MFGLFNKKQKKGDVIEIKIEGMHCTSCSLNIDNTLEETDGILSSDTSYAKSRTTVKYDKTIIKPSEIVQLIKELGYEGSEVR